MRKSFFPVFCITMLSLTGVLNGGTLKERFEKSYRLEKGGELILSNTNGSVFIESWQRNEVKVVAEKTVKSGDRRLAEKVMDEIKIDVDHDDNFLEIRTDLPKRRRGFWGSIFGDNLSISVKYKLIVPETLRLDIATVNGGITVTAVSGKLRLKSTNGRIRVRESGGSVHAKTTNGGIEVELKDFDEDEDMSFKTTNGGIVAYFPRDFRAYVNAKTTNGSIKTDFPIEVRGRISKRRLKGSIHGGGGKIELHTTNGSIKILER
ncbi:MAG: DUF4097 domain-containing protein [bacterium]